MTIEIDFTYAIDGFYHSVNYYRSDAPMDIDSMPAPTATDINGLTFLDTTAEENKRYYVRFGSVRGDIEKVSHEIIIHTFSNPIFALYKNGELGFWYDIQDLSKLFQDDAGTIPVTAAGQKVGRINDKSGNGWHLTQSVDNKKPVLGFNEGKYYLIFNGTSTFMSVSNTNFGSSVSFSLFIAQKKLQDGSSRMLLERSSQAESNNGSFNIIAPGSSGVRKYAALLGFIKPVSMLNDATVAYTENPAYSAPNFSSIYSKYRIKDESLHASVKLFVNKVLVEFTEESKPSASNNFGNHNMYLGARSGSSLFYNGHIYEIAGVARLCTQSEEQEVQGHMMNYSI